MQKVPDSIVQNGNTTKVLALIQAARAMDIAELCKRGDYNQPGAHYQIPLLMRCCLYWVV